MKNDPLQAQGHFFWLVELVEDGSDDFENMQLGGSVVVVAYVATGRNFLCDISLCLRSEHVACVQLSSLSHIIPVTEFLSYISSRVTFLILHVGDVDALE